MNQQLLAWLPVLSPIATMIMVLIGIFFSNRHVDVRIADVNRVIAAESGRLEAVIKAESATLRLEIQKLEAPVKALEERAGLIYRS